MALQDKQPETSKQEKQPSQEKKETPRRATPRRGSELAKIQTRLTEFLETIAAGQQMLGTMAQDPRVYVGGKVTEEFTPTLVDAWVSLAEESPAVKRYLSRLADGTAWGEVTFATMGYVYSMAQAYGTVPIQFGNPWIEGGIAKYGVPISPEVANHMADANANGRQAPIITDPPAGDEKVEVEVELSQAEAAEEERKRIEERRKNRKGPLVE